MAKSNLTNQAEAKMQTTSKLVNCLDCALSRLHRYGNNPILSACEARPREGDTRFPFEVQVASFLRICKEHKHTDEVKEIEQRKRAA